MRVESFFILAAFAVGGCERVANDERIDIPDELAGLRSNAFRCWQDSEHVPVENSEHCVTVAEEYFGKFRPDCGGSRSYDCMNHTAVLADIRHLYTEAIIQGLINFGIPDWIQGEGKAFSSHVYFDGELMRRRFRECLETERNELAKSGLHPVTEIMDRPLEDGQLCFRMGYPEFFTARINQS